MLPQYGPSSASAGARRPHAGQVRILDIFAAVDATDTMMASIIPRNIGIGLNVGGEWFQSKARRIEMAMMKSIRVSSIDPSCLFIADESDTSCGFGFPCMARTQSTIEHDR